jgi:hypothetical protein
MTQTDLSHWDTVEKLSATQLIKLAIGIDPYTQAFREPTQIAKERLLSEHLEKGHLNATAWALDVGKQIAADEEVIAKALAMAFDLNIPANGASPIISKVRGVAHHAGKTGLMPSVNLVYAFELAAFEKFDADSLDWIKRQGESLPDDAMFERDAIHDWLKFLRWQSAYNFAPWRDATASKATEKTADSNLQKHRWPWGNYETKLLKLLPLVYEEHWQKYDPARPTTAPKSEVVTDWLVTTHNAPRRVAEVIAQLFRADAIPKGPRRETK